MRKTGQTVLLKGNFISLKIFFVVTNSVDPDEMPHYAAFNLDLLCTNKICILSSFN